MSAVNPAKFVTYQWGPVKVGIHKASFFKQSEVTKALTETPLDATPPADIFVGISRNEKSTYAGFPLNGKTKMVFTPTEDGFKGLLTALAGALKEAFPKKG